MATPMFAQGIEFYEGKWEDGIQMANKSDKLMFVDAYAVWCGPCKRMSQQVFPQEEVGSFFNKNFVNMKIDMEKGQGIEFRKLYPVSAFPTFFFIDGEGNVVYQFKGARDAASLINEAKNALNNYDGSAKYAKLYEEGNREFDTVIKYIRTLNRAGKSSLKVANDYLLAHKNMSEEENARLLFESCTQVDSRIFSLLMEHEKEVLRYFSPDEVETKILEAAQNTFDKSLEFNSPDLEKEALTAVKKNAKSAYKLFAVQCEMQKAERNKNADEFVKLAAKYHNLISGDLTKEKDLVSDLTNNYGNHSKALKLAVDISEGVAIAQPNIDNYMKVSQISAKLNDMDNAMYWAKKALELAQSDERLKMAVTNYINQLESKKGF